MIAHLICWTIYRRAAFAVLRLAVNTPGHRVRTGQRCGRAGVEMQLPSRKSAFLSLTRFAVSLLHFQGSHDFSWAIVCPDVSPALLFREVELLLRVLSAIHSLSAANITPPLAAVSIRRSP